MKENLYILFNEICNKIIYKKIHFFLSFNFPQTEFQKFSSSSTIYTVNFTAS